MKPSNNLLALVSAYDPLTPLVASKEEFKERSLLFLARVEPCLKPVGALFEDSLRHRRFQQHQFDALLSIALDAGLDLLFSTPLPELVRNDSRKSLITDAIGNIPTFDGTVHDGLVEQLKYYRMDNIQRRTAEAELYFGCPCFVICRFRNPATGDTHYKTTVMHPFLRFLCRMA